MLNLLPDAVKSTDRRGAGAPTRHDGHGTARPAVQGTGTGIPADRLESVFAPFVEVGQRPSNVGEGTGVGLATSRDPACAMHGDLGSPSATGSGTTFTLDLPPADGEPPRASRRAPRRLTVRLGA